MRAATRRPRPVVTLAARALLLVVAVVGALLVPLVATATPASAANVPPNEGFSDVGLSGGLGGATAVERAPDGSFFVTGKNGQVWTVAPGGGPGVVVLDLSARVCTGAEMGLLGVAVDPFYASNHFIYLYHTVGFGDCVTRGNVSSSGAKNRVSRFTVVDGNPGATINSEAILLDNMPEYAGNHNGGEIKVAGGTLFIGVGDGGGAPGDRPAHFGLPNGKILRINTDGSVPPNPFGGTPCFNNWDQLFVVCAEIWATGLRNPFRFGWDLDTLTAPYPRFMVNDVGQNDWEEANLLQLNVGAWGGAHFGWPCREGPAPYPAGGCNVPVTEPVLAYPHGGATEGCDSVTGGAFVPGDTWGSYGGSYLWVDFICGRMFVARPGEFNPGQTDITPEVFATGMEGTTDVEFFADGTGPGTPKALFYTTIGGELRRITAPGTPAPIPDLKFVGTASGQPARVLDTRNGIGVSAGKPGGGGMRTFSTATPDMPAGVQAVALNLTATEAAGPGFVTAWPSSTVRPLTSSLNLSGGGETAANAVVVPVDFFARVNVYTQTSAHLIADVTGYFVLNQGATDGRFTPSNPTRILDTRDGTGGKATPFSGGEQFDLAVANVAPVPAGTTAVAVTVTYVDVNAAGYVTVWPTGSPLPNVSTLNPNGAGDIRSNLAIVPIGDGGRLSLFSLVRANLVVDVVGWFAEGTGATGLFTAVPPTRVADSRYGFGFPRIGGGSSATMTFAGWFGPPSPSAAVLANVTATNTISGGYVTAYPADLGTPPFASTVNWSAGGQTRATLSASRLAADQIKLFAPYDVDVVLDVSGWFSQ